MVMSAPPFQTSSSVQKPLLTYEFTKRKRWADLLVTELTDVIIFVLSPTCKVLYCGTAVTELLGWRDVDLVDYDLVDLISCMDLSKQSTLLTEALCCCTADDQADFRTRFDDSVRTGGEMLSYVRLKCNETMSYPPTSCKDVLFEIKGYPHVADEHDVDSTCFFAMAKPYPGRNTAMYVQSPFGASHR